LLGAGDHSAQVISATWLVPSLLCYSLPVLYYGTAAWRSQQPFLGAGDYSAQVISAAWLVPSLLCYPLPVLYNGTQQRGGHSYPCWVLVTTVHR
jgi:hypothetical protein